MNPPPLVAHTDLKYVAQHQIQTQGVGVLQRKIARGRRIDWPDVAGSSTNQSASNINSLRLFGVEAVVVELGSTGDLFRRENDAHVSERLSMKCSTLLGDSINAFCTSSVERCRDATRFEYCRNANYHLVGSHPRRNAGFSREGVVLKHGNERQLHGSSGRRSSISALGWSNQHSEVPFRVGGEDGLH